MSERIPTIGDNGQLKSIVNRIEVMDAQIKDLADDRKEIYSEAKSHGYDLKVLRSVVTRRKADAAKLAEHEALVETYMDAIRDLVRPS